MSKTWKIIIAIVITVVALGLVGAGGFVAGRNWTLRAMKPQPGMAFHFEGRPLEQNRKQLLLLKPFAQGFKRDRGMMFGPGFGPQPAGMFFGPFFLLGGLIKELISLAFLALLISMTVFFYRRWQPALVYAPPPAPTPPEPARSQPGEASTEEAAAEHGPTA